MVGEPVILHLPWILALSRRGGALIAIGVTLAAGGIVTGGIYQPDIPLPGGGGGGATPGTANLWIDTNGGTCARSSSPVSYNTDTACASMQAAHAASVCGDTVGIAPGSYGAQSVSGSPLCSLGSEVHFISYDTTRPTFADLNFAKSSAGLIVEHVSTPGGIDMTDRLTIKDSTFKEFSAAFDATGSPDNWTLDGNDINGNGQVDQNFIWDSPSGNGATGWKIVNNTIRNFYDDVNPSDHTEGIYLGGYSDNGLIAGNTFTNNGNSSQIFVTWFGNCACPGAQPGGSNPRNICIRDNIFNATHGAFFDINTRDEITTSTTSGLVYDTDNSYTSGVDQSEFNGDCG